LSGVQVAVIAATCTPAALAPGLNRPGGNLTGPTNLNIEVTPKRLEILHQLLPVAKLFAPLVNSTNPYEARESRRLMRPSPYW
jgi:putative ABC transport system substrate-binding protein